MAEEDSLLYYLVIPDKDHYIVMKSDYLLKMLIVNETVKNPILHEVAPRNPTERKKQKKGRENNIPDWQERISPRYQQKDHWELMLEF
jgi:hypothetical protein